MDTTSNRTITRIATAALLVLGLAGCSAVSSAFGVHPGDKSNTIVIIDPTYSRPGTIIREITPAVRRAAESGGSLRVLIARGASSLGTVQLPDGGKFTPKGKNASAWASEAETNMEQSLAAISREVGAASTRLAVDLVSVVRQGLDLASTTASASDAPSRLVVFTQGVTRSERLDLLREKVSPDNAARLAKRADLPEAPTVEMTLIGIGGFPDVSPPESTFVAGVTEFWKRVCDARPSCTSVLTQQGS